MGKFILLTRQRTGSTVLARTLDEHPNIFCAGEIFHHGDGIHHSEMQFPFIKCLQADFPFLRSGLQIPWGIVRTNSFLTRFFEKTLQEGATSSGFKLMLSQIRLFPMTKLWLQKPDIKKIVLIRDNALDIVISDQRARQSGQSHLNSGDRKTDFTVSLDLRSLERKLRSVEANNQRLYRFADQTNALLIKYEDILSNWNKTLSTLFDYLGVNPIALPPVLQKRSGIYLSPESVI